MEQLEFRHTVDSRWCHGKQSTCQCRRHKKCRFDPWVRKTPWSRKWQPTPYSCLENPMDRGAWQAIVHGIAKSWTQLKWRSTAHTGFTEFCSRKLVQRLLGSMFFALFCFDFCTVDTKTQSTEVSYKVTWFRTQVITQINFDLRSVLI